VTYLSVGFLKEIEFMLTQDIKAGDLILLSSNAPLAKPIQSRTGSIWSQVALAIRDRNPFGNINLIEATQMPTCPDVHTNSIIQGVGIVRLEDKLQSFDGAIAHRALIPELDEHKIEQLSQFARTYHGMPYSCSGFCAIRAIRRRNPLSTYEAFFCSELVAAAYQFIGIISQPPNGRSPSNYIPVDFTEENEDVDWIGSAGLGQQNLF